MCGTDVVRHKHSWTVYEPLPFYVRDESSSDSKSPSPSAPPTTRNFRVSHATGSEVRHLDTTVTYTCTVVDQDCGSSSFVVKVLFPPIVCLSTPSRVSSVPR